MTDFSHIIRKTLGINNVDSPRLLIADAWNSCPPLETGLEIAALLGEQGFYVDYLHYGAALPYVECYNKNGNFKDRILGYPPSPQERGVRKLHDYAKKKKLKVKAQVLSRINRPYSTDILSRETLASIDTLKQLSYKGSNKIGMAVASSLVSITRDPDIVPETERELCTKLAASFKIAFHTVSRWITKKRSESLILFNGRFSSCKGAVMAAENAGIPVFYHELGSSIDKFGFFPFPVHDRLRIQQCITEVWDAHKHVQESIDISNQFFVDRRAGIEKAWYSFSANQNDAEALSIIEQAKKKSLTGKVIVYFHSCEDEFASIEDCYGMNGYEWKTQAQALNQLVFAVKSAGHSLVVRVHPNLEGAAQHCKDQWNNLTLIPNNEDILIVPSHSKASSYKLIDSASLVASYGSTVGIEAVFWNKPSLLMGDSLYDSIHASLLVVKTIKDLFATVKNVHSWTVDQVTARPYGYYMNTFGFKHSMYTAVSFHNGLFLGENLRAYNKTVRHEMLDFIRGRKY